MDSNPLVDDPLALFTRERDRALALGEPWAAAAAALATVTSEGAPSVRFVLVKDVDARGPRFFTNRESDKGRQLAACPHAALAFHFVTTHVQIRFEGPVAILEDAQSDAYFASRPRESQLGAWASVQSRPSPSRADLERRLDEVARRFEGRDVPRPPFWGGYLLTPVRVEHWSEGASRLHDRRRFERLPGEPGWRVTRLDP